MTTREALEALKKKIDSDPYTPGDEFIFGLGDAPYPNQTIVLAIWPSEADYRVAIVKHTQDLADEIAKLLTLDPDTTELDQEISELFSNRNLWSDVK